MIINDMSPWLYVYDTLQYKRPHMYLWYQEIDMCWAMHIIILLQQTTNGAAIEVGNE